MQARKSRARPAKRQRKLGISHIYSKSYLLSSSTVPRTTNQMIKDRLLQSTEQFVQCQKAVDPLVAQRSRMEIITVYLFEPNNGANIIELEDERNVWRAKRYRSSRGGRSCLRCSLWTLSRHGRWQQSEKSRIGVCRCEQRPTCARAT